MGCVRLAAWAALVVGCDATAPAPRLEGVSPARVYSDRPVRLVLRGDAFVPSWEIDPAAGTRRGDSRGFQGRVGSETAWASLRDFGWRGPRELSAWMEPGLGAGVHSVEITDPRGSTARLPDALEVLGPDRDAPELAIESPTPEAPAAPGTRLRARIVAWDREPGRIERVRYAVRAGGQAVVEGECPVEAEPAHARCAFELVVPTWAGAGDLVELAAEAADDADPPNRTERRVVLRLRARPAVRALAPARGGTGGGTDLLVRGDGFLPGSRAFLGDVPLVPDGGIVVDEQTISGRAPPHRGGPVVLVVRTPLGDAALAGAFVYQPPPLVEAIAPESGDPDGGTLVRVRGQRFTPATRVLFGVTLAGARPLEEAAFVDPGEIRGLAPGGQGRGSVWAVDPELGWTRLADGFAWSEP